jgi:phosphoribosylamine---glycine ligase
VKGKDRIRMNVLLIGGGGREHALAWAISASPLLTKLYCAPGNPGIAQVAEIVSIDITNHASVIIFCQTYDIEFVVVGPEAPLVAGLVDDLKAVGIKAFGPSKFAARLEGSKGFTKDICAKYNIPTAAYGRFTDLEKACAYLARHGAPIVIKADGLAAGKGVTVAMTLAEARAALDDIFSGRFGEAECVIEEFLEGEEASFFVLSDGLHTLPLATAQDHKRVGEGDVGPNTGGMGAYSPAPCMTDALCVEVLEKIVKPAINALRAMGHPYVLRLRDDILTLLLATVDGTLDRVSVRWRSEFALTVVLAAEGYPNDYVKGTEINGLSQDFGEGLQIFHAGTTSRDGKILATGGRVLNVTALGKTAGEARQRAYAAVDKIDWPQGFCRRDIGWRAVRP